MKIEESVGEVIRMSPNDGPRWYVRGHLTADDALGAVAEWMLEDGLCDEGDEPELGPCQHLWGRWQPANPNDGPNDDSAFVWCVSTKRLPGRARVTAVWSAADWQDREERCTVEAEVRARVMRRWPTARITYVSSRPWRERHDVTVRMRFEREGAEVVVYPWRGLRGEATPINWRTPRVAFLDRISAIGLVPR